MQSQAKRTRKSNETATPAQLINAAILQFGLKGFAQTSTREIAAVAGVNIAGIAYHFGGKDGLRKACGLFIVDQMRQTIIGPAMAGLDTALSSPMTQSEAENWLLRILDNIVHALLRRHEAEPVVRFILREQMDLSPAFTIIHDGIIAPVHEKLCLLWSKATGAEPHAEATKLVTLTFVGQVLYFRIARNVALKRLEWSDYDANHVTHIVSVIQHNLVASLAAARRQPS